MLHSIRRGATLVLVALAVARALAGAQPTQDAGTPTMQPAPPQPAVPTPAAAPTQAAQPAPAPPAVPAPAVVPTETAQPAPPPPVPPAQTDVPATAAAPTQTVKPAPATSAVSAPAAAPTETAQPAPTPPAPPVQTAQPAPPPEPPPLAVDHPRLLDTATLVGAGQTIKLFGIVGQTGPSVDGLKGYIAAAGDRLTCQQQGNAEFICQLPNGTDIAMAALINGAAQARADAPEPYQHEQAEAQSQRRGFWASLPPPPVSVKHPDVQDTATLISAGQPYALDGIEGLAGDYANSMQGYIAGHGDSVLCQPQGGESHYVCLLPDGTDVAKLVLVNGAAQVAPDASDAYRLQQADAINNRRGIWANLAPADAQEAIALLEPPPGLIVQEEPLDGLAYIGDTPTAIIDGETAFLVYMDGSGWGYWDHDHHWRGAPDRFGRHLDRFHPEGHGLRGYDHGHFDPMRVSDARPGLVGRPVPHALGHPVLGTAGHPVIGAAAHPMVGAAGHTVPNIAGRPAAGFVGHPTQSATLAHAAAPARTPTATAAGPRPAMSQGRPASAGFVHPTMPNAGRVPAAAPRAAPAVHAAPAVKCKGKC